MSMDSQMQEDAGAERVLEPSNMAAGSGAPANAEDSARSEKNILQWVAYLPRTCVRTMIRMGWDKST
jgi:hypothetical protein